MPVFQHAQDLPEPRNLCLGTYEYLGQVGGDNGRNKIQFCRRNRKDNKVAVKQQTNPYIYSYFNIITHLSQKWPYSSTSSSFSSRADSSITQ